MLIIKIMGLIKIIYSLLLSWNKRTEEEEKESLSGLIVSFVITIGSMFGVIYLINNYEEWWRAWQEKNFQKNLKFA